MPVLPDLIDHLDDVEHLERVKLAQQGCERGGGSQNLNDKIGQGSLELERRFEPRVVLEGEPPPVDVSERLRMAGIGDEILAQEPQRRILISEHCPLNRVESKEIARGINV